MKKVLRWSLHVAVSWLALYGALCWFMDRIWNK